MFAVTHFQSLVNNRILCFCMSIYNVNDISYENILIYSLLTFLVGVCVGAGGGRLLVKNVCDTSNW